MKRAFLIFSVLALPLLLRARDVPPPFGKGEEEAPEFESQNAGDRAHEHEHEHGDVEVDAAVDMLVQVQVEFIELPHEKLSELLMSLPPAEGGKLRGRAQELIKGGVAKILETQVVTGRSGEKLDLQAVQELIYPTEYDTPVQHPDPAKGPAPESYKVPFAPSSFETRNIGSSLEAAPTLSADGKVIDLRIKPELTWYTGDSVWLEQKDSLGNVARIQMPEIYSLTLSSALTLRAGSTLFTAALTPKDERGKADFSRKVMVFVKADVIP